MISKNAMTRLVLTLSLTLAVMATGCSSAKKKSDDEGAIPAAAAAAAAADENVMGDSDSGKAMGLQTVFFPYDSFTLDQKSRSALKANADILKSNEKVHIQIEGHCDQRGGIQYNIALGEKRANATMKYLVDLGVAASRMTVISLGKEKPMDLGTSEEAYAKNRRSNFVITSK